MGNSCARPTPTSPSKSGDRPEQTAFSRRRQPHSLAPSCSSSGIERRNQQDHGMCASLGSVFTYWQNFISVSNRHENIGENQIGEYIRNFPYGGLAVAHGNDVNALILQASATILWMLLLSSATRILATKHPPTIHTWTGRAAASRPREITFSNVFGASPRQASRQQVKRVSEVNTVPTPLNRPFCSNMKRGAERLRTPISLRDAGLEQRLPGTIFPQPFLFLAG